MCRTQYFLKNLGQYLFNMKLKIKLCLLPLLAFVVMFSKGYALLPPKQHHEALVAKPSLCCLMTTSKRKHSYAELPRIQYGHLIQKPFSNFVQRLKAVANPEDSETEPDKSPRRFDLNSLLYRGYRRIIIYMVGILFTTILKIANRVTVHNHDTLKKLMLERDPDVALFSYSNHHSMLDDPGIPAVLMPWLTMRWKRMRWALCNDDMYYAHPFLTHVLELGKTLPVSRTDGPSQKQLKEFMNKLEKNKDWCHIFT